MLPKLLSNSRGSLDFVKCYCAAKLSNTEIEIKSLAESEDDGRHQRLQVARDNSLQLHLFSNENTPIFLTDPNAIALYLSSTDFAAKNNLSLSCQVSQWLSVAASELRPFQGSLSNSGGGEDDKGGKGAKFEHVSKVLQGLNHYLRLKTFLVGERMSLADVAMAIEISSIQSNGYIQFTDEGKCDLPYLQRWFKTVANQPALREIVNLENGPGDNWKSRKEEKEHKEGLPLEQAGRPSNEKDVLQKKTKKKDKSNQRQKPKSNATTTSDADQRKLRILCLHGYRQNEASFREKTGAFRKIVSKFADLTFISAPLKVPSSAGGEEKDEQTGGKKEEGDKVGKYAWSYPYVE